MTAQLRCQIINFNGRNWRYTIGILKGFCNNKQENISLSAGPSLESAFCLTSSWLRTRTSPSFAPDLLTIDCALCSVAKFARTGASSQIPWFAHDRWTLPTTRFAVSQYLWWCGLKGHWRMIVAQIRVILTPIHLIGRCGFETIRAVIIVPAPSRELLSNADYLRHIRK